MQQKSNNNELIHETSPYLLQHAHNPVNWYPWKDQALDKAIAEDKMLIISVGYAACHWCHVMAHESFESEEVAKLMNEHFISIKVDREERPDVDTIYMAAAQLISGNAGWPLNAFALPDGRPFFATTYLPEDRWIQLLGYFIKEYRTNKAGIINQANQLAAGIVRMDQIPLRSEGYQMTKEDFKAMRDALLKRIDSVNGGLATTMKFPRPPVWEWLLAYGSLTGDKDALGATFLTLDKMMDGGIYDQIGGGFARYSTDPLWHTPHFEKMLFDNAQLISLYSHAYQISKNEAYKNVVTETIGFVSRELSDGSAFLTSLDADSEGEEGKYYTWTHAEIKEVLGADARIFAGYYGVTPEGNWEDEKNILDKNEQIYTEINAGTPLPEIIARSKKKLLERREKRIRPAVDDKVITAWNAMFSSGLIQAYRALGKTEYYQSAEKNIHFLLTNLWDEKDRVLYRNFQRNKPSTPGFLDDYAFLIKALVDFYQGSFDINYLVRAKELINTVRENFHNPDNEMFFYNDIRFNRIISRPVEVDDNVIPSSNSVLAECLLLAGSLLDDAEMIRQSAQMLENVKHEVLKDTIYQTNWGRILLRTEAENLEVAIIGNGWRESLSRLQKFFLPNVLFCGSSHEENLSILKNRFQPWKTLIYVCRNKACQLPVSEPEVALNQIKKMQRSDLWQIN